MVFDWVGNDDPQTQRAKAHWLRLFVLLHQVSTAWYLAMEPAGALPQGWRIAHAVAVTGCFGVGLLPQWTRVAVAVLAGLVFIQDIFVFPMMPNHAFLELALLITVASFDIELAAERDVMLKTAKWIVVVCLVASGLQKLLHGTYFHGEVLAMLSVTEPDRFGWLMQHLMPASEFARLHSAPLETLSLRIDGTLFLLISNSVWVAELTAPLLLLMKRTRPYAVGACLALIAGIELCAREVTFGLLIVTLLLLFFERDKLSRAVPAFAVVYLFLIVQWIARLPQWLY